MPTFCLLPAERFRMRTLRPKTSPPVKCSKRSAMALILSSFTPEILFTKLRYSSGVRKSMRKPLSMKALVKCFQSSLSSTRIPFSSTLPSSAFSRSRRRRKSVVFPAPLLPTRPIISPFSILREGMSQAQVSPNDFLRFFISIIIPIKDCFLISHTSPLPWQFLNFLPLPHGHGSFLPGILSLTIGSRRCASRPRVSCAAAAA